MSGHSKWAQIKRSKGAADQKKARVFGKLANEIAIAAREGSDPAFNFKLRSAIERARQNGMSKEAIERAVKRGANAKP
jgi:transcriptional/translational regulatory protein YebC/TACO1